MGEKQVIGVGETVHIAWGWHVCSTQLYWRHVTNKWLNVINMSESITGIAFYTCVGLFWWKLDAIFKNTCSHIEKIRKVGNLANNQQQAVNFRTKLSWTITSIQSCKFYMHTTSWRNVIIIKKKFPLGETSKPEPS